MTTEQTIEWLGQLRRELEQAPVFAKGPVADKLLAAYAGVVAGLLRRIDTLEAQRESANVAMAQIVQRQAGLELVVDARGAVGCGNG